MVVNKLLNTFIIRPTHPELAPSLINWASFCPPPLRGGGLFRIWAEFVEVHSKESLIIRNTNRQEGLDYVVSKFTKIKSKFDDLKNKSNKVGP
jgi:hypothetical protein